LRGVSGVCRSVSAVAAESFGNAGREEHSEVVKWRKRLVPAIAVASVLLASGPLASGVSHAEEAVLIPGAAVFKQIDPLHPIVAKTYPNIGRNFHDDPDPQIVDYSQNPLDSDRAILDGVRQTTIAVRQNSGDVVVIGESMGSMVAWRVAAALADSPDPPARDDVRVVVIAPPEVGVAAYFKEGTHIPVLNYQVARIAKSSYDMTIVIGEYDGWADPPDRPWNLIASANALAGIVYVHGPPIFTVDVTGLAPTDYIAGDDQHGSVTTYLVPTARLPLTQVFRDVGVPDELVDKADQVLRPIIDAGYVRHDQPGDTRPYLDDGEIRRNAPSPAPVRTPALGSSEKTSAVGQGSPEHSAELAQAVNHAIHADPRASRHPGLDRQGHYGRSSQVSAATPHRARTASAIRPNDSKTLHFPALHRGGRQPSA
jgi:pimeloyl-ACP methyl ester carboxylesterase